MGFQSIKDLFSVSLLENMAKVKSLVLISSVILYADCMLSVTFRKNIQNFDWQNFGYSANIFQLIVSIFIYCALASVFSPMLYQILALGVNILKHKLFSEHSYRRIFNYETDISIYSLRNYAKKENNGVLFSICEKFDEEKQYASKMSKHTFFVFILLLFDCFIFGDEYNKTIIQSIGNVGDAIEHTMLNSVKESAFGGIIAFLTAKLFMILISLLTLLIPAVWWGYSSYEQPDYIVNPELAKLVNKKYIDESKKLATVKKTLSMRVYNEY